jgi:hypothetical protein
MRTFVAFRFVIFITVIEVVGRGFREAVIRQFLPLVIRVIYSGNRSAFCQHVEIGCEDSDGMFASVPTDRTSATGVKDLGFPPDTRCVAPRARDFCD